MNGEIHDKICEAALEGSCRHITDDIPEGPSPDHSFPDFGRPHVGVPGL